MSRHKPSLVVLASQVSAAVVHGVVKSLESGADAVDPFQILLVRMAITGVGCSTYMWLRRVPEFPLGDRDLRPMLLLRAAGGVLGAGGMYCQCCTVVFSMPMSCVRNVSLIIWAQCHRLDQLPHAVSSDRLEFSRADGGDDNIEADGPWKLHLHRSRECICGLGRGRHGGSAGRYFSNRSQTRTRPEGRSSCKVEGIGMWYGRYSGHNSELDCHIQPEVPAPPMSLQARG